MSAKTKIVVVKMKHVILTGVLLGILLLLIIFAATYFFSGDEPKPAVEETGMCVQYICSAGWGSYRCVCGGGQ